MANIISGFRIICGLSLLCFPAFSRGFYFFYILGGISDAVDGMIARRLDQVSEFGSKVDTGADIVFALAAFIKVLTAIYIPVWLWVWIAVIALIKMINIINGFVLFKKFVAAHTRMNKVCGGMVFFLPFCIGNIPWQFVSLLMMAVCIMATFAAIQEGYHIRRRNEIT